MIFVNILVFILGIYLTMRMIAALYGVLDFWYTIKTAYPVVILRIAGWGAVMFLLIFFLNHHRLAFLLGMLAYGCIYLAPYFIMKVLLAWDVRSNDATNRFPSTGHKGRHR